MLSEQAARELGFDRDYRALAQKAHEMAYSHHRGIVTYSRKVFIPLTHLCRDVCHYCTFAQTPSRIPQAYLPEDEVLELARQGAELGCQEALFTLGEKPELRYKAAREALASMGYSTTLEYVARVAQRVRDETGLLPHINAGNMTEEEIAMLRPVSASMGIMLESASERLCQKGMPHYGSPDKIPATRLQTLKLAGEARVPFTTGILIGIGETRAERIDSLLEIRRLHQEYGHIQEIIIQNFRAKANTKMAAAEEPALEEMSWTLAVARLIFGPAMNIQAPPNLSPEGLNELMLAGINDWGGVSPLTPDHVNPEAPWPHLDKLAQDTANGGGVLEQRLTIYPSYIKQADRWLAPEIKPFVLRHADSRGLARRDSWRAGTSSELPRLESQLLHASGSKASDEVKRIVDKCLDQKSLQDTEIARLFDTCGDDFSLVVQAADKLRQQQCGDTVSYVVNRNINYTNVCYFKCQFCAFSKGKQSEDLRGKPYDISAEELARRCQEAWRRGASEVCLQGGIHPDYSGQTYLDIVRTVHKAAPDMHIHAFSPLEVFQGAATLGIPIAEFLQLLKHEGLGTLPGTAAEILDDEVRQQICPDKLNTEQWLGVMRAAHETGFNTTATIMFGHVDNSMHWAHHLLAVRKLQQQTMGFTEFVPLPYVASEAPMYRKGLSRQGPTFRESLLMHAVPRLVFNGSIPNIQASWVKMGFEGALMCLSAGANDLGGTLMNESITRAAGASHGQEWHPLKLEQQLHAIGRTPRMRKTNYESVSPGRYQAALCDIPLADVNNEPAGKKQRSKRLAQLAQAG